jgi:hypothetical protein
MSNRSYLDLPTACRIKAPRAIRFAAQTLTNPQA